MPVLVAPMSAMYMAHKHGEPATARAAVTAKTSMVSANVAEGPTLALSTQCCWQLWHVQDSTVHHSSCSTSYCLWSSCLPTLMNQKGQICFDKHCSTDRNRFSNNAPPGVLKQCKATQYLALQ